MSETGNLKNINEELEIEWKISNIISVSEKGFPITSPQFAFANIKWQLLLFPYWNERQEFFDFNFDLMKKSRKDPECSVEHNFFLKNLDGSVALFSDKENFLFSKDQRCSIILSDLELQHLVSQSSGVLTVGCTLRSGATYSLKRKISSPSKSNKFIKLDTLSDNYRSLFLNKDSCDATLLVMDKEFKAHRAVLIARSKVFAPMFLHDTSERETGIVKIPDCDPGSFGKFLEFLYTGKLEEISPQDALHLCDTANKYDVSELKTFCFEFLEENMTVENFCAVTIRADMYDNSKLLSKAQKFFYENLNKVLETEEWDYLARNNYDLSKKLLKNMASKLKVAR